MALRRVLALGMWLFASAVPGMGHAAVPELPRGAVMILEIERA